MNREVNFDNLGGLWVYQDTLKFLQIAYSQSFDAIAASYGDKLIIGGVEETAPGSGIYTDGWVIIGGVILPFVGGNALVNVEVETLVTDEQYDDATQKPTYSTSRVVFRNLSGFPFTDLKRLPFNSSTINDAFLTTQKILKNIVNLEPAVIIDGCVVSNVNTGGGTIDVSVGMVMFNGEPKVTPLYSGLYPAYLTENNVWVTALPGSGLFIQFDPHTSQRYKDVLNRFNHDSGRIVFSKVLNDRFDVATGLGKWEWLGWKICDTMSGRVPLGYDRRTADPSNGIWDINYNGVGNNGGEKVHQLSEAELPIHTHQYSRVRTDIVGAAIEPNNIKAGSDRALHVGDLVNTTPVGGDISHENRQPYEVIAIFERL